LRVLLITEHADHNQPYRLFEESLLAMALNPIVPKTAYSTQPPTQSDSSAQPDETSFSSAAPAGSGVFKQCAEPGSQPGETPTFFSSSSSFLTQDSFCSELSTLEDGFQSGGNCETKVFSYGNQRGLDNGSRETLLAIKMGSAALTIDVLLKVWGAGQRFTERQALAEVQHLGIGRRTLRNALYAAPRRHRLFHRAGIHRPKRGRPAQLYELPSAAEVASRLGISRTPSDELKPADLRGLTTYRAALHREFIRRSPGVYTRGWLAGRLGVSKRTVRDYDKRAGIKVTPQIDHEPMYSMLHVRSAISHQFIETRAPYGKPHDRWLEDPTGKRYPLMMDIAKRLFEKFPTPRGKLPLCFIVYQRANKYEIAA
jgi:hypothetical protein